MRIGSVLQTAPRALGAGQARSGNDRGRFGGVPWPHFWTIWCGHKTRHSSSVDSHWQRFTVLIQSEREIYEAEFAREYDAVEYNEAEARELLSLTYQIRSQRHLDANTSELSI